jgi:1-deoxy-D-xylulose-5-phosphate reductoisomerase
VPGGAVYAQMSRPDMRLPIQSALFYPDRACAAFEELSFDALTLEFSRPDEERFPMLALAYKALRAGELYPAAYNAANEFAVAAFLSGRIGFFDISGITGAVLDRDWSGSADLETVWETHRLAARFAETVCRF